MASVVPYQKHSETSAAAAERIGKRVGPMEAEILNLITVAQATGGNGLTDAELIAQFGSQSARPRRIRLVELGRLKDSGSQRKTPSGYMAVVWMLA